MTWIDPHILKKNYTIAHQLTIHATTQRVFDAVSDPSDLINWWPLRCSGLPLKDELYNFYFGEAYDWYGKVVESSPNRHFHIKMTQSDDDWDPTTFGYDLTEIEERTRLNFWHSGWQQCNKHYHVASCCWALLLRGLKEYIEEGKIIPFEKRS